MLSYALDDCNWLGAEAHDNGVYYAIEEGTGHIYRVGFRDKEEIGAGRFVNSNLAQFAEYLLCCREFLTQFRLDRSQYEPQFASLKQKWRRIDSAALMDPDNYWVMCLYYQF